MGRGQVSGPANTQIGVSPTQVVEVVNANMSVWTKSGARVGTDDLGLFFSVPPGFVFADPNILYDSVSGRWFLSGSAFNAAYDSFVYIAASQTSNPAGTWYIYTLATTTGVLMDQPLLGNGDQVMTLVWADFATPCSPGCTRLTSPPGPSRPTWPTATPSSGCGPGSSSCGSVPTWTTRPRVNHRAHSSGTEFLPRLPKSVLPPLTPFSRTTVPYFSWPSVSQRLRCLAPPGCPSFRDRRHPGGECWPRSSWSPG